MKLIKRSGKSITKEKSEIYQRKERNSPKEFNSDSSNNRISVSLIKNCVSSLLLNEDKNLKNKIDCLFLFCILSP